MDKMKKWLGEQVQKASARYKDYTSRDLFNSASFASGEEAGYTKCLGIM